MPITVDVQLVRDILGPMSSGWTDDQISSRAVVVMARRRLLEWCPSLDLILDNDSLEVAQIALATQIAANLILTSPRMTSSRLGDSSVTFGADSDEDRAGVLEEQARDLIGSVCPIPETAPTIAVFRTAPGGRAL